MCCTTVSVLPTFILALQLQHTGEGGGGGQQVDLVYPEIRSSHISQVSLKSDLKLESSVL